MQDNEKIRNQLIYELTKIQNNAKTVILIVDDSPHLLKGMCRMLETAGYEIIQGTTGTDCLRLVKEQLPDMVLLDVVLPDIDGLEVCKKIKADVELANTYVVLISSKRTGEDDEALGLELMDILSDQSPTENF